MRSNVDLPFWSFLIISNIWSAVRPESNNWLIWLTMAIIVLIINLFKKA